MFGETLDTLIAVAGGVLLCLVSMAAGVQFAVRIFLAVRDGNDIEKGGD